MMEADMAGNKTVAAYGDKGNMFKQAAGLFAVHMNRNSGVMANLVGKMPTGIPRQRLGVHVI